MPLNTYIPVMVQTTKEGRPLTMAYEQTALRETFRVKKIVTVHYFEYEKNFIFTDESHNFWEFTYVDKGEIEYRWDGAWHKLGQGEIVFHKPGVLHNHRANGKTASNTVIVSFICSSRAMRFFEDRVCQVKDSEKQLLATVVREAGHAFSTPLGDPYTQKLEREPQPVFGAEQMIGLSIEQLLISLYRSRAGKKSNTSVVKQNLDRDTVDAALSYLEEHLGDPLRFADVAAHVGVSGTCLKNAFRVRMDKGVMACFREMRLDRAKLLIREDNYNFTQIAALLGYDSIHHFSRQFRQYCGMSPTEYARSVKAIAAQ